MNILEEIGFLLLYSILVYAWNTYVVPRFVKTVVDLNDKNKWLAKNEPKIVKVYQIFFWFGLALYILSRLFFLIHELFGT